MRELTRHGLGGEEVVDRRFNRRRWFCLRDDVGEILEDEAAWYVRVSLVELLEVVADASTDIYEEDCPFICLCALC